MAVAFAAFCVWLAVRIVNRRERWAKWTLGMTVGLPVLYVASFEPWCWVMSRYGLVADNTRDLEKTARFSLIYQPVLNAWDNCAGTPIGRAIDWYANLLPNPEVGSIAAVKVVGASEYSECFLLGQKWW